MIVSSNILTNASWLDPVGGLVISLMVVQAGWGNTKASLLELADVGVEDEMKDNVREAAVKALDGLNKGKIEVRAVQGVKSGQNYLMDVELGVPANMTIDQTRGIEDHVRERVGANVRGVKKVRVRFVSNTAAQPDFMDEFIAPSAHTEHQHEEHSHDHSHSHEKANGDVRKRK